MMFHNIHDKMRRYFSFSRSELRAMAITTVILGFIFSFRQWGTETFEPVTGIENFIAALLLVLFALLVRSSVQRIVALAFGYQLEYHLSFVWLMVSLAITFVSAGTIVLPAIGWFEAKHLTYHRIGHYKYGASYQDLGWIASVGALANMALAIFFAMLSYLVPENVLLQRALIINIWIAIFNLLPFPGIDGLKAFYGSRIWYVFVFAFVIGLSLLISYANPLLAIFVAVLFAILAVIIFGIYVEDWFPKL